jgi:hypothetical protein
MSLSKVNVFNFLDNQSTLILVNSLSKFSYFSQHLLLLFCLDPFMSLDEASELDYWLLSSRRDTSRRATNFRPTTSIFNIHLPSSAQQQKEPIPSVPLQSFYPPCLAILFFRNPLSYIFLLLDSLASSIRPLNISDPGTTPSP